MNFERLAALVVVLRNIEKNQTPERPFVLTQKEWEDKITAPPGRKMLDHRKWMGELGTVANAAHYAALSPEFNAQQYFLNTMGELVYDPYRRGYPAYITGIQAPMQFFGLAEITARNLFTKLGDSSRNKPTFGVVCTRIGRMLPEKYKKETKDDTTVSGWRRSTLFMD